MRSEPDTGKDMSPRLKRIIVLATLGAFLLSACAEASWVATVNDEPVEEESVLAFRESYQAGESSVAGEPFRQDLTGLIVLEAQIQAAEEDFGLTGLDDAARRDDALANVSPFDRADVERVTSDPDLTEESLEALGTQLAVRNAVLAVLAVAEPGFLEELWSNRPVQTTQVCVRHIIVATEDEIDAVAARIAAGEDFSTRSRTRWSPIRRVRAAGSSARSLPPPSFRRSIRSPPPPRWARSPSPSRPSLAGTSSWWTRSTFPPVSRTFRPIPCDSSSSGPWTRSGPHG